MATLNRFPLFGLWNRVAAQVLGYDLEESKCIGHGVAVLYAIRAQGGARTKPKHPKEAAAIPTNEGDEPLANEELGFGGDSLPCEMDEDGRVLKCLVGCRSPKDAAQTPRSYDSNVDAKISAEYRSDLEEGMRRLLETYKAVELGGKLVYRLYDGWKKDCKAGRRVDLDKLLEWLEEHAERREKSAA